MRKERIWLFFGAFFLFALMACSGARPPSAVKKDAPPLVVRTGVYEGLVSVDGQSVYVITNYKSRSRVDYLVTGELKDKVAALDGQLVTVEGTAKRRGWSGTLEVVRILKPKRLPGPPGKKALPSDTKN